MVQELKIVTFKWDAGLHPKKNMLYSSFHVNQLQRMLDKHLHVPFQLVCITDECGGINSNIEVIPLWKKFARYSGCFRRLRIFSSKMKQMIGSRFACIDLDVVIVDDVTSIFNRDEDFIIWGEHWRKAPYCPSFMIMDAGCREQVYDSFDIKNYPANLNGNYPYGTDQDHINRCLYPREEMVTTKDGIFNFNFACRRWSKAKTSLGTRYKKGQYLDLFLAGGGDVKDLCRGSFEGNGELPDGARIIFLNGKHDPADRKLQKEYPWIKDHWQNLI